MYALCNKNKRLNCMAFQNGSDVREQLLSQFQIFVISLCPYVAFLRLPLISVMPDAYMSA